MDWPDLWCAIRLTAFYVAPAVEYTRKQVGEILAGLGAQNEMPIVAGRKLKAAARLGSKALRAGARGDYRRVDAGQKGTTMHVDGQQTIALGIVAVAAFAVGRRLWRQIAAFGGKTGREGTVSPGCDNCPSSGQAQPKTTSSPLMQIQIKPPLHLRRPPG